MNPELWQQLGLINHIATYFLHAENLTYSTSNNVYISHQSNRFPAYCFTANMSRAISRKLRLHPGDLFK